MATNKGTVIKTIALAAILLALLAAMVSSVSAASKGDNFNSISKQQGIQKVIRGQNLEFNTSDTWSVTSPTVFRIVENNIENTYTSDLNNHIFNAQWPATGAYYVNYNSTGPSWEAQLSLEDPSVPMTLKVGEKVVWTIAVGTPLRVDTGGINLFDEDRVNLEIISPDGKIVVNPSNPTQTFRNITVSALKEYGSAVTSKQINTTGWKIGDYTLQIKTRPEYACGLSAQSVVKALTIIKDKIDISAEKTTCVELQTVKLTVTGAAYRTIWVGAYPSNIHAIFPVGVNDNPLFLDADHFNHTIDEDSTRTYAVRFNATGYYTIKVIDWGPDGVFETPDDSYDTVDIKVSEKAVTFDVPPAVVIGERFTIKGTANTGERVSIAVDDYVYPEHRLVIGPNGEFEKEIDTSKPDIPPFTVPGCVNLKAYIDRPMPPSGPIFPDEIEDGSVMITMLVTHLNVTISKATVSLGDSFEVYGNASSDHVEIVTISTNGGIGTGMNGLYGTSIYTVPTFCNYTDYNFYKKIKVDSDADTGNYTILVLSPDRDEIYGNSSFSYIDSLLDLDGAGPDLGTIDVSTKTQEQIIVIIEAIIYATGSNDFIWMANIIVTPLPVVSVIRDLPDAVRPGEEFNVSLTQSGFVITGLVTETLPEGFSYRGVLSGGKLFEYNETTRNLTMDYSVGATTLIYQLGAGTAEQIKNAVFSGTWNTVDSQLNIISGSIEGETTLTPAPEPTISGKVTYTCNATGIAGANVNLTQSGSVINSTMTDADGNYTFIEVTPGVYSVNASKPRFWDNATEVTVTADVPTEADMMLWLKGDVYNDGVLDIYDIIMLRQAAAENIPWDYRYDLYVDAMVDIYDIIVLRQAVAGNIVLE